MFEGVSQQTNWDEIPEDPDLHRDLDYHMVDLDVFGHGDTNQVVMVASEEQMLRENAFIVAAEDDVCDPLDWV